MASAAVVSLQRHLNALQNGTYADGEAHCHAVHEIILRVKQELQEAFLADQEALSQYRALLWGKPDGTVVRLVLQYLALKEKAEMGSILLQGLLATTETLKLMGLTEIGNALIFSAACFKGALQIRPSRLIPVVKILKNVMLWEDFPSTEGDMEMRIVDVGNMVLQAIAHLMFDPSGIGHLFEVLSIYAVNFRSLFQDQASVSLIMRRIEVYQEMFRRPPLIEISQVFSVMTDLLKHTNIVLPTNQLSMLWILWKQYFRRDTMSVRSVAVVKAVGFMREHFQLFSEFIASDSEHFYHVLLDFAFSSEANRQNRAIEDASFELAIDFTATLPLVFKDLGRTDPNRARALLQAIAKLSYNLALKSYKKMCFGVISLGCLPLEAFEELALIGARFSTVFDSVTKFLGTYKCGALCKKYCVRPKLLLALVEATNNAKDSAFFDVPLRDVYARIEHCWLSTRILCEQGTKTNAELFSLLLSTDSERSRPVTRFLNYLIETEQSKEGVEIWKTTCDEIPLADVLSEFVSISMSVLAKELISLRTSDSETVISLFAGICSCKSISTQLERCFFSVLTYFMDNFLRTKSLHSLSVVASLAIQEGNIFRKIVLPLDSQGESQLSSAPPTSEATLLFAEKITQVCDVLIKMLLRAPFSTVEKYIPCFAVVPSSAFDDEKRSKKVARLVEVCLENKCGDETMNIIFKICERSQKIRRLVAPLFLKKVGDGEVYWRNLDIAASGHYDAHRKPVETNLLKSTALWVTVGPSEVDLGSLLTSFSRCFRSEEMMELYLGLLETVIQKILYSTDEEDNDLLRFCCEELLLAPGRFAKFLKKNDSSDRLATVALKTLLLRCSRSEGKISSSEGFLKDVYTNRLDLLSKEVLEAVTPHMAADLLKLFNTKGEEHSDVVLLLLKQLLMSDDFIPENLDNFAWNWSSLPGIEKTVEELFLSQRDISKEALRFGLNLLPSNHSIDLPSLVRDCMEQQRHDKAIILLEEGPESSLRSEEVLSALENLLTEFGWITVAWRLRQVNPSAFGQLMERVELGQLVRSVLQSSNSDIGVEVLDAFLELKSSDVREDVKAYIIGYCNLSDLLVRPTDLATVNESIRVVRIYEKLVLKGILEAPFSAEAVIARIVGDVDVSSRLAASALWNQLLQSSVRWETSIEDVADCAYRLFAAERKDLLAYFYSRLEEDPTRFIERLPSEAEHILLKILEGQEVGPNVKPAIFDFARSMPEDRLFTPSTLRLLRNAETLPWKPGDLPAALRAVSLRQSKKLKCAFLELVTKTTEADECFYSQLVTDWVPLEGAEPNEVIDAILASENAFLWKHLLLNVFFVGGNPAAQRVVEWIVSNASGLSGLEGLLEVVLSISTNGGDVLPRLPSKAELRQFKIVENVLPALLQTLPLENVLKLADKWMKPDGFLGLLMSRPSSGIKEIVLLLTFEKIFDRADPTTIEQFCLLHPNVGPSRQALKTFLVVRSLDHLKKSLDDGRDPFMWWKFHCHAFSLCAAVLQKSKPGKTRHTFLDRIFSLPVAWERIAGEPSTVGISFGDEFTAESSIRKRKAVAEEGDEEEEMDDHDFTKVQRPPSDEATSNTSNRTFEFDTHPSLPKLIALANHCLYISASEDEEAPSWLKGLKSHVEADKQNLNVMVLVLRFIQICGELLKTHQNLLDSVVSNALSTIIQAGASIDCVFVKESFALCSHIDSGLSQLLFNGIFSSITNSLRKAHLKLFAHFYDPTTHHIQLMSLEDALSPAIRWCRYEAMAIFYRHDQDHGVLDVHRVNWKDTVEELSGSGGAFLKKSLAKMVSTVIAMSERKGYDDIAVSLKSLSLSQLRTAATSEQRFRLVDVMAEEYPAIVDEFVEDVLLGFNHSNCRYHCFRLLKILVTRIAIDVEKLSMIFSFDFNVSSRLQLLAVVKSICQSELYDKATQERILDQFMSRGVESYPSVEYLQDLLEISAVFPKTVAGQFGTMWSSLKGDMKQFLLEEWLEKGSPGIEDVAEPELALRITVGTAELMRLFGGEDKVTSQYFSKVIAEEPQIALELLPANEAVLRRCVDTATSDFHPRLAWKLMNILKPGASEFQEIVEIYGVPSGCWPPETMADAEALFIARNCLFLEDALVYLRNSSSLADEVFRSSTVSANAPSFVKYLAATVMEKWDLIRVEELPEEPSRMEIEIFARAQLEKEHTSASAEFWDKIAHLHFEAQVYYLEYRIQQLDIGSDVLSLIGKLQRGLETVWLELDEEKRIGLLPNIRAISDADAVVQAVSHDNANSSIIKLCTKWSEIPGDRSSVLRRIRFLKAMSQLASCSSAIFAILATSIVRLKIQLLRSDISLTDPLLRTKVSFLTKERKEEILKEIRLFLPGCAAECRSDLIAEVEGIAEELKRSE